MLYPLKFKPRLKERIWGGSVLIDKKGKAAGRVGGYAALLRDQIIELREKG